MAATPPEQHQSGQQILHYRLAEKLGEGGMGVVWKATDTTLDRSVAIKVLPPGFASDAERLARFEREAKLLASLNHPNIATVYSVHVVDSVRYLSMELVPGEDLTQRIARGPVPVPEAIEIARQIALALEAAHENGIVHRDLKPANIRVTPDGRVKVLDFGLAKAVEADARAGSLSQSPTYALSAMTSGMIIGTAAYMSPEQARGQSTDRRADIWAFGVVLYEMLSGARAFDGETVSDTLAAVLRAEPDRAHLPKDLPARVRVLLDRCLEKSPRRRLRDIGEALLVLEDVIAGRGAEPEAAPAAPAPARGIAAWWPWLVTGILAAVAVAALLRPGPAPPAHRKYTLSLQRGGSEVLLPSISPDGTRIAYVQDGHLWVRDLSMLTSRELAEGLDEDFRPAWSPDGENIAFANAAGVSRVGVAGGAVSPVCAAVDFTGGTGACWTEDDRILFTRGHDHIYQVAASGGVATVAVARIDSTEGDLHHPVAFPGKRPIACIIHSVRSGPSLLALVEPGRRDTLLSVPDGFLWDLAWDPRGYLIYGRLGEGAGLWALPFSPASMKATGEPFLIAPDGSSPSVSARGTLSYRLGSTSLESAVVTLDRSGTIVDTIGGYHRGGWSLAASPDGRYVALEVRESGEGDIWLNDLVRGSESRFAFGTGRQGEPAWSPDSREIAYREFSQNQIVAKPVDGSRSPRRLARGTNPQYTGDGRHILYCRDVAGGASDIWQSSTDGSGDSSVVVASPRNDLQPVAAPHAPFVAYESDESGRTEVYLRPMPPGEGRWQVSSNGGRLPRWSFAGDRLYYVSTDHVFEVEVSLTPEVRLGTPRLIFDLTRLRLQTFGRNFFVPTRNPDRFLTLQANERTLKSATDVVLVEDWPAEFAKRK